MGYYGVQLYCPCFWLPIDNLLAIARWRRRRSDRASLGSSVHAGHSLGCQSQEIGGRQHPQRPKNKKTCAKLRILPNFVQFLIFWVFPYIPEIWYVGLDSERPWHSKRICEMSMSLIFYFLTFLVNVSIILPLLLSLLGLSSYCLLPTAYCLCLCLCLFIHSWAGPGPWMDEEA